MKIHINHLPIQIYTCAHVPSLFHSSRTNNFILCLIHSCFFHFPGLPESSRLFILIIPTWPHFTFLEMPHFFIHFYNKTLEECFSFSRVPPLFSLKTNSIRLSPSLGPRTALLRLTLTSTLIIPVNVSYPFSYLICEEHLPMLTMLSSFTCILSSLDFLDTTLSWFSSFLAGYPFLVSFAGSSSAPWPLNT